MALLTTHAQDAVEPHSPPEIVVSVRRGSRVSLIFAAADTLPSPPECVSSLDKAVR